MKKAKIFFVTWLSFLCMTMSAQTVSVEDIQVTAGRQSSVVVKLQGCNNCIAAGFSLVLPDGAFNENNGALGFGTTLDNRFVADHVVVSNQLNDRTIKTVIYSPTNTAFKGGSGSNTTLLNVDFMSYGMTTGVYQGQLKDFEIALAGNQIVKLPNVTFKFTVSDVDTDIRNISEDKQEDDVWYDLNGRRLTTKPNTKGVYIKNGKKVVNK